ncbi:glycosyltransferase family 2 protein [Candidatus Saccharibacteria bacterium]|nr:glycosyltransferase family 2 protein [Candidatus Saccharibacteria bacterium]MCL1963264.1 glycosyltransferase family 2 protein [Candidatus Saccharibacteria bacterium]
MKNPTLSIIILCYNEEKVIERCLMSVMNQTVSADEIVVVDNNSTDNSAKIVRRIMKENPNANIHLVHEKQQGMIPARNHGLHVAKSEILGRIDSDSTLNPNWVKVVKKTFRDKTVMGASGPVVYNDMPLKKIGLKMDNSSRKFISKVVRKYKFLFGSNMALRKSAWEKIKDKTYFALANEDVVHEDVDISLCLTEANLKIVYNPEMIGGMSARRIEDSPRKYAKYNKKFSNAFKIHGLKPSNAYIPMALLWAIYPVIKPLRFVYNKTHREKTKTT